MDTMSTYATAPRSPGDLGRILDVAYPADSEPISKTELTMRISKVMEPRSYFRDMALATGVVHSLAYAFGAIRFEGDLVYRTGENLGPADLRYARPPARETRQALYDEDGNIVDVPHSKVAAFVARVRETRKQRKVEQIRRDLQEAGIDPATVGGLA